jgi:pimeloyl-ACP methyl ester carboxylesterase
VRFVSSEGFGGLVVGQSVNRGKYHHGMRTDRHTARMRVEVDDVRLYFDVEGCGLAARDHEMVQQATLVLLHGGPGADHSLFKPEFSTISDMAQVIYLDQRGSGRSDHGEPDTWTWERWADDVAGLCQALEIGAPVLVGTSSGGRVALECAARHPDLVAGLVLDSTLGAPSPLEESLEVFERRGGRVAREAAARFLGGDMSPAAARAWAEHGLPLYAGSADGDMEARRARARINDTVQTHFRQGGCGPVEITPETAARITCPILILAGQDDPVTPAAAARRLAALLPRADVQVEIMPGAGHGVFRQVPTAAFDTLRRFLPKVASVG